MPAGSGDHPGGIAQIGDKAIEHIPQPRRAGAHAMNDVEPAPGRFHGWRTGPVLHLLDRVIDARIDNFFRPAHCRINRIGQRPSDPAAFSSLDEAVLGPGIPGILSFDKFGVQDDIPLLRRRALEIGQPLPPDKIPGSSNAALGLGLRGVTQRRTAILALHTEDAVDPTVLVLGQPHVVNIRCRIIRLRDAQRNPAEAEPVNARAAFRQPEKTLPVHPLDSRNQIKSAIQIDRAGVESGIDTKPLEKPGIRRGIKIVSPKDRRVGLGQNRVSVAVKDAILPARVNFVWSGKEGLVPIQKLLEPFTVWRGVDHGCRDCRHPRNPQAFSKKQKPAPPARK